MQEHLLVQRITVNDEFEMDMALLLSCTYVETLDLSGPRIMLTFSDRENIVRDDYKINENTVLEIAFSDQHIRGGIDIVEKFVVKSVTAAQNQTMQVVGFVGAIHLLKMPTRQAIFVNGCDAKTVIQRNLPGVPVQSGMLPAVNSWHLLPGERPSKKIRQLSRELGAAIYYCRNTFNAKSLKELFAQEPFAEFHYDDRREENQILSYQSTFRTEFAHERMRRSFIGWDITEGLIQGARNTDAPLEMARFGDSLTLDALNSYLLPAIDFECNGWGALKPGLCLSLKFHRSREGKPYDESIPGKVLIYAVSHHYATNRYACRVKGGVVYE